MCFHSWKPVSKKNICDLWAQLFSTIFPAPPTTFCTVNLCANHDIWRPSISSLYVSSVASRIHSEKGRHIYLPCLGINSHLQTYLTIHQFLVFSITVGQIGMSMVPVHCAVCNDWLTVRVMAILHSQLYNNAPTSLWIHFTCRVTRLSSDHSISLSLSSRVTGLCYKSRWLCRW